MSQSHFIRLRIERSKFLIRFGKIGLKEIALRLVLKIKVILLDYSTRNRPKVVKQHV